MTLGVLPGQSRDSAGAGGTLSKEQEGGGEQVNEAEEEEEEAQVKHVRELVRRKRRRARARLSGPAWEAVVKGATEWNSGILRERFIRGPWYWDPHSRSSQLYRRWSLSRTPNMIQLEALATYLHPLTPDQQSTVLTAYMAGPAAQNAATHSATFSPAPSASGGDSTTSKKARGKRARPKGPHCRMCLKEELDESMLMRCTECNDQYHPDCLELKKENIPKMMSFGWRCMHCKKCETCKDTGDEEKLLFCDACDRGFHTFCLKPPLKRPPSGGWFCVECVECKSCGTKKPGKGKTCRWHRGYTMCEVCYKRFKHKKYCPVCLLAYKTQESNLPDNMRSCASCQHSVHITCDPSLSGTDSAYVCPPCRKK